ncbi:MAG: CotH kinase family protein, partial [Roseibacillus sp.]|nr:CotH kinase family protein [Roseibacillus sp.]
MQKSAATHQYLHCAASLLLIALLSLGTKSTANPVINEIFYHENHGTGPENSLTEWIELYNPSAAGVDLSEWSFSQGITFTFAAGTILPGTSYLVIAADPPSFNSIHPGADIGGNILGPWVGRLRNSGETITLVDQAGNRIDRVRYADEGDWAERRRGPVDNGHQGWTWTANHDGEGASLELINPALSNNQGQNWGSSITAGGSPGSANSILSTNTAPLIKSVRHTPVIPRSGENVIVQAELDYINSTGSLLLFWRLDGDSDWASREMNEGPDGALRSEIPGQPDGTVIEFYLHVFTDSAERTWPAPSQADGEQQANALLQFDDSYDPYAIWVAGSQPKYRIVMTEEERAELADIGDDSESPRNEEESNAEMSCTFIVEDGTGLALRYLASVRNRGASSRNPPPNNFLVKFRGDDPWNGCLSVKFNAQYPHSQVFGSRYLRSAGIETAEATASLLRINGEDLARSGSNMFGSYAQVESFGSEYTRNHWPLDPDGNLYQVRDNEDTDEEGDLRHEGPNADSYRDTYFKKTNEAEDNWSDLIALTDALNNAPVESYFEDVGRVVNIDQWVTYFALDTLAGNREGGLITSKGDDYGLYSGIADPRFVLVPHDLDTMFNLGNTTVDPDRSIWSFDDLPGLVRFFQNDEVIHLYYRKLLSLIT